MGRNTFNLEQVLKNQERQARRKPAPRQIQGDYEIEATGSEGWFAYRYEFKVNDRLTFGYAETIDEARENILKAQA